MPADREITQAAFSRGHEQYGERRFIIQTWKCAPEEAIPVAMRPAITSSDGCLDKDWVIALYQLASVQGELRFAQQLMLQHTQMLGVKRLTLKTMEDLINAAASESVEYKEEGRRRSERSTRAKGLAWSSLIAAESADERDIQPVLAQTLAAQPQPSEAAIPSHGNIMKHKGKQKEPRHLSQPSDTSSKPRPKPKAPVREDRSGSGELYEPASETPQAVAGSRQTTEQSAKAATPEHPSADLPLPGPMSVEESIFLVHLARAALAVNSAAQERQAQEQREEEEEQQQEDEEQYEEKEK